jgi:hypothetical protein
MLQTINKRTTINKRRPRVMQLDLSTKNNFLLLRTTRRREKCSACKEI